MELDTAVGDIAPALEAETEAASAAEAKVDKVQVIGMELGYRIVGIEEHEDEEVPVQEQVMVDIAGRIAAAAEGTAAIAVCVPNFVLVD